MADRKIEQLTEAWEALPAPEWPGRHQVRLEFDVHLIGSLSHHVDEATWERLIASAAAYTHQAYGRAS